MGMKRGWGSTPHMHIPRPVTHFSPCLGLNSKMHTLRSISHPFIQPYIWIHLDQSINQSTIRFIACFTLPPAPGTPALLLTCPKERHLTRWCSTRADTCDGSVLIGSWLLCESPSNSQGFTGPRWLSVVHCDVRPLCGYIDVAHTGMHQYIGARGGRTTRCQPRCAGVWTRPHGRKCIMPSIHESSVRLAS